MLVGGCLCGACQFQIDGALGPANYCHCTDCRRTTGSAFNIGARVSKADFALTRGAPKAFTKTGDSGHRLSRHFCGACGSPLFTSSPRHPEWIFVKAGALDDPGGIRPEHESWTQSEVGWARIPDGLPRYPGGRGAER
jgi:hypothetical protein